MTFQDYKIAPSGQDDWDMEDSPLHVDSSRSQHTLPACTPLSTRTESTITESDVSTVNEGQVPGAPSSSTLTTPQHSPPRSVHVRHSSSFSSRPPSTATYSSPVPGVDSVSSNKLAASPFASPSRYPIATNTNYQHSLGDLISRNRQPSSRQTLLDKIKRWYNIRKGLEAKRYLRYVKHRCEMNSGPTEHNSRLEIKINTADLNLTTYVGLAESHLKPKLANPEYFSEFRLYEFADLFCRKALSLPKLNKRGKRRLCIGQFFWLWLALGIMFFVFSTKDDECGCEWPFEMLLKDG